MNKKINSKIKWIDRYYRTEYEDLDSFDEIVKFNQIYGVCFVNEKIVLCYNNQLGFWVLPGGTPEGDETVEQAMKREIMEEAGLELISYKPIGVQKVYGDNKIRVQLRAACICKKTSKPNDPTGDITELKYIDIKDVGDYIDWG